MDGLKAFTQVLPLFLAKLEIIRQILEAHGILGGEIEVGSGQDKRSFDSVWNWNKPGYILTVEISFDHASIDDHSWVAMYLRPTQDGKNGRDGIWVNSDENGWVVGNHRADRSWYATPLEADPIDDLWSNLIRLGIDEDYAYLSETVGHEALGMIATFFAKLPEDPPKPAS